MMPITARPYRYPGDYDAVGRFLVRTYDPMAVHRNWLQPRWEYMHYHPALFEPGHDLGTCGLWESGDEIVGVAHFEHRTGVNYLQIDPEHTGLIEDMLAHAEAHLWGTFKDGTNVYVYLDDRNEEAQSIAAGRGYEPKPDLAERTATFAIPERFPEVRVPDRFCVRSLDEVFDLEKVHRIMHRGFNHRGEPPEDELDDRRKKLSAPNFRKDLTIVAVAPDGDYASFCGIWMDHKNRICYVEPVATDPEYRRLGLGTAVVLEAIRRCGREGATIAYVGSDQAFYLSMGFQVAFSQTPWKKPLSC